MLSGMPKEGAGTVAAMGMEANEDAAGQRTSPTAQIPSPVMSGVQEADMLNRATATVIWAPSWSGSSVTGSARATM